MTELFKCLAVFCAVSVAFGFTDVRDDVTWFKNEERIRNKFVTGVVNGILDSDCSIASEGEEVQGECMSKVECNKLGGTPRGLCSLMGSCCVIEKTCSETTTYKTSYFVPPKKPKTPCVLTVKKSSSAVCQIRLDFEKFDLAQPTTVDKTGHGCLRDQFLIEGVRRRPGFLHLCGKNSKQHMYIHLDKDQTQIDLRFNLALQDREEDDTPVWRIKVTQLECVQPGSSHFLNAPTKLMAIHNNLKQKTTPKCYNCDLLAPPGCLQYYRNDTGTFESFNYNGGNGPYIANLHYAICLKQTAAVCGARFKPVKFQMNQNGEGDKKVCHPPDKASKEVSQDYIRITEGFTDKYADHYCGKHEDTIIARSYEPLYVGVHTDGFLADKKNEKEEENEEEEEKKEEKKEEKEKGFRIRYELLTNECYPPTPS